MICSRVIDTINVKKYKHATGTQIHNAMNTQNDVAMTTESVATPFLNTCDGD